jgi:hypothetical protein
MALRVARLALLISILAGLAVLGLSTAGAAPSATSEWLFAFGLVLSGWTLLSAVACVVLQLALLLARRRAANSRPIGHD